MIERYELVIAGPAVRALAETIPAKVAMAAYEFMTGPLLDDPRRLGKPLHPPLAPLWSARRGSYRILYFVHEERRTVEMTAVCHRADAYRG